MNSQPHTQRLPMGKVLTGLARSQQGRGLSVILLALGLIALPAQAATITVTTTAIDTAEDNECSLIEAIDNANADANDGSVGEDATYPNIEYPSHDDCAAGNGADIIELQTDASYTFTAPNQGGDAAPASYRFFWYGPNALPAIASDITIEGNGATIERTGNSIFRFFYVGADPLNASTLGYTSPGAGKLTLKNLTLKNGLARGGSANVGGAGAGMGGAIFSQGNVSLDSVTLDGNSAEGGSIVRACCWTGGAGMGANATNASGSGFGGGFASIGASGGNGRRNGGGGGGGSFTAANGGNASGSNGGAGGGSNTGT
ncbi:MAG: hypothetical protein ACSHXK_12855, partial [Oceanococcus sp.]